MESPETGKTLVKTIALERRQMRWEAMDLESLIAADHPARTIWELSGRFDLSRFEKEQKTREGQAGRFAILHRLPPRQEPSAYGLPTSTPGSG